MRSVALQGRLRPVQTAAQNIYKCLERQAHNVKNFGQKQAEPISKDNLKTSAKFVILEAAAGFIIGKQGAFTKFLEEEMNIYMKCFRDHHNIKSLHKDETICMMTGSLADV